jgi:hypothetical protein
MKLSNVLARINGSDEVKTASDSSAPATKSAATSQTADKLRAALKEATAPAPVEKQAAAASPVGDLTKLAAETVGMEHEALVKEAQFYGAACADGFMARLSQYNEAATKIASQEIGAAKGANDDSFEKFASENQALVKQAAELGYDTTKGQMDKLAEAAYTKGYDEAVGVIYKTAHESFTGGYEDTLRLLSEIR